MNNECRIFSTVKFRLYLSTFLICMLIITFVVGCNICCSCICFLSDKNGTPADNDDDADYDNVERECVVAARAANAATNAEVVNRLSTGSNNSAGKQENFASSGSDPNAAAAGDQVMSGKDKKPSKSSSDSKKEKKPLFGKKKEKKKPKTAAGCEIEMSCVGNFLAI